MNAAEATILARKGKVNDLNKTISRTNQAIKEACAFGLPGVTFSTNDSWDNTDHLKQVVEHFENEDFDVSVKDGYLTIYWGLEDSEIEAQ